MHMHRPYIWIPEIEYYLKCPHRLRSDHRELRNSWEKLRWVVVVCMHSAAKHRSSSCFSLRWSLQSLVNYNLDSHHFWQLWLTGGLQELAPLLTNLVDSLGLRNAKAMSSEWLKHWNIGLIIIIKRRNIFTSSVCSNCLEAWTNLLPCSPFL